MKKIFDIKNFTIIQFMNMVSSVASFLIITVFIVLLNIGFRQEAIRVYEDMEESFTIAVFNQVDPEDFIFLAEETAMIFEEIRDEVIVSDDTRFDYTTYFTSVEETNTFKTVSSKINKMRSSTAASSIDFVLFYPEEEIGVYVFDASDVNVYPCGTVFSMETNKRKVGEEFNVKGFNSWSEAYGWVHTDGVSIGYDEEYNYQLLLLSDIPIEMVGRRAGLFSIATAIITLLIIAPFFIWSKNKIKKYILNPLYTFTDATEYFATEYEKRADTHEVTHVFENIYTGKLVEYKNMAQSLRSMELEMGSYLRDMDEMLVEKGRISTELDIATTIQKSSIPTNFEEFNTHPEFDLYANMVPAKEVGGDFYNYFMIDEDHLGLVMADVSGKGIPAALFMMVASMTLENRAMESGKPSEVLSFVNDKLCANNIAEMFVTIWFGILTISTGEVIASNAGHEYPVITDENGRYKVFEDEHGFVTGCMEGMEYEDYTFTIPKNGKLYLYTDGVPEASNLKEEFYGMDRMLRDLNDCRDCDTKTTIERMYEAVGKFADGAEPFDDTTMLCLWYKGKEE